MRPLHLSLKGFTSFRDEQVVDFDDFDLFAISGPTGSGKTSILDAVTYALFGTIDRVGKHAGQFVSQGQTRMAVCFDFAADDTMYRVTRSTTAKGVTQVRLERRSADGWEQAGEGSDKVAGVNAMIREAIGLDYETFTRTVLLPQGRFAEFLVGDAKQRREILTDLLGLHLFERLARRAGECKRAANVEAETRARLLETEYTGVTPEAVELAEADATDALAREERLAAAKIAVDAIAVRGREAARSAHDLRGCAAEIREAAATAVRLADELEGLATDLTQAEAAAEAAAGDARVAIAAAHKADVARRKAEGSWGRARTLAATRVRAEALLERRGAVTELGAATGAAKAATPSLAQALSEARAAFDARVAEAEAAIQALDGARVAVDEATHADLVAAVRSGIAVGDDCPVCGSRIEVLPKARRAPTLEKAKAALAAAERTATAANDALGSAKATVDDAERNVRASERDVARLEQELLAAREELSAREAELRDAFGGRLPKDPVATLDERLATLDELEEARTEADETAASAARASSDAGASAERLRAEVATRRARLEGIAVRALFDRARRLGRDEVDLPEPPSLAADASPAEVAAAASRMGDDLEIVAGSLDRLAEARAGARAALLEEALIAVDGLLEPLDTLDELVASVASAHTASARDAATARERADQLARKLENAATLVQEVAHHRRREERFDALAKELRADRIIAFLQHEALQVLAAAGSARLAALSSARYRLEYVDDEFYAVDTWNGEERRSARTLSGGETFLASLALALALSEQVGSLSVTEKARLDSLFLDEGFGSLDPETLEVVVEAIEQLGGDGRVVGVITHVPELAARMPVRIEVEKSPRGSRIRVTR